MTITSERMNPSITNIQGPSVLIVGAGAVGLTLALELTRRGVPFRIIDKRPCPDPHSKALSLSPATLERFEALGVVDEILGRAQRNAAIEVHFDGRPLQMISMSGLATKYPYFAMISQAVTEGVLRGRLESWGLNIERGVALRDLAQGPRGVVATLGIGDDVTERLEVPWLVATDGARSSVREKLAIQTETHDHDVRLLTMDAEVKWPCYEGKWVYSVTEARFAIVIPMAGGLHRVVVSDQGEFPAGRAPTVADVQGRLDEMGLPAVRVAAPVWASSAAIVTRLPQTLRVGRAVLAGDAAHAFSPIGGQGLNTGVQDAAALGWRLEAVLRGGGPDSLMTDYAEERLARARVTREWTDELTRLILRRDRDRRGPLRAFLDVTGRDEFLREVLPRRLAGQLLAG